MTKSIAPYEDFSFITTLTCPIIVQQILLFFGKVLPKLIFHLIHEKKFLPTQLLGPKYTIIWQVRVFSFLSLFLWMTKRACQLKLSSSKSMLNDQSESWIMNPALWLVVRHQNHRGNPKLIDHVASSVTYNYSSLISIIYVVALHRKN